MSTHLGSSVEKGTISNDGVLFYSAWSLKGIGYFEAYKGIIISYPEQLLKINDHYLWFRCSSSIIKFDLKTSIVFKYITTWAFCFVFNCPFFSMANCLSFGISVNSHYPNTKQLFSSVFSFHTFCSSSILFEKLNRKLEGAWIK